MDSEKSDNSSVQVVVRIRPLISSEVARGCRDIVEVFPAIRQIRIKDTDKAFTYNYVCDSNTSQDTFYNMCVKHMIDNLFKGYNMTILAYGQTGSGKTHSMGTTYNGEGEMGVIPRAINDIFNYVNDNFAYDFNITVSFMELYQEILYDLLAQRPREQCVVEIREDLKGIIIPGLTEEIVTSASRTLEYLAKGSLGRATGSTNMNTQSSRSHAIFTINICMQKKDNSNINKTAKFHLVDLAGSERSKKTGATGVTFREGININKGLLALGNVISALGDDKQPTYIGYRDSNLTRLLKDSLGGNSITLMIACISPADYNLDESLSTLRYADRARKIKNKPVVNQDPKTAEINRLNKLVQQLRLELIGQGGPIICQAELDQLRNENSMLKSKNNELTRQLSATLTENTALFERVMLIQVANEQVNKKLLELKEEYNITLNHLNVSIEQNDPDMIKQHVQKLHAMQELFTNIDNERQRADNEIRKHERCNSTVNLVSNDAVLEYELDEVQENHTKQQMVLNSQLQEVTQMLAMKEHLAQQMATNVNYMVDYEGISQNEKKIAVLEKEKNELLQQLKTVQVQGGNNKIAEQRRKRVQELEKEIQELHKKLTEQARLIKLKEKDEQKIKQLNSEILQMKCTKVKLIKNMKQESEKFRTWKLQRERELIKLKEQDRKRQNQIVQIETKYSRQQNVLKRKVEEAAAINKRLKDALALRKTVQDQKNSGKLERIEPWVRQELDVYVSTIDAEATLNALIQDRATLSEQLEQLKSSDADPLEIKKLAEEMDLTCTQIQELQQKILDSDQDNKTKTRWENIQSMGEAKFCLKLLFELASESRRKEVTTDTQISDLQNQQAELLQKLRVQEKQIKIIQTNHDHELSNVAKDCEEKIAVLLRQLRNIPVAEGTENEYEERYLIQQKALEQAELKIETIMLESEKKEAALLEENSKLKKTIEEIKFALPKKRTKPEPSENGIKVKSDKTLDKTTSTVTVFESALDESDTDLDDLSTDPDWRKTPLSKRIRQMRSDIQPVSQRDRLTVKRGSDGSCACKGNCSAKNCGCRKVLQTCGLHCKCSKDRCKNREAGLKLNDTDVHSSTTEEEDSFKRPRPFIVNGENISVNLRGRKLAIPRFDFSIAD